MGVESDCGSGPERDMDAQFLWRSSLMVAPVLREVWMHSSCEGRVCGSGPEGGMDAQFLWGSSLMVAPV